MINWSKEPWFSVKECLVSLGAYLLFFLLVLLLVGAVDLLTKIF